MHGLDAPLTFRQPVAEHMASLPQPGRQIVRRGIKMIHEQRTRSNSVMELVSVRAPQCLMPDQMTTATDVLAEARGWSVDQHVDYDGCVMIVAARDATGQTFALSGRMDRIELAQVHEDGMLPCGTFTSIETALDALLLVAIQDRV